MKLKIVANTLCPNRVIQTQIKEFWFVLERVVASYSPSIITKASFILALHFFVNIRLKLFWEVKTQSYEKQDEK